MNIQHYTYSRLRKIKESHEEVPDCKEQDQKDLTSLKVLMDIIGETNIQKIMHTFQTYYHQCMLQIQQIGKQCKNNDDASFIERKTKWKSGGICKSTKFNRTTKSVQKFDDVAKSFQSHNFKPQDKNSCRSRSGSTSEDKTKRIVSTSKLCSPRGCIKPNCAGNSSFSSKFGNTRSSIEIRFTDSQNVETALKDITQSELNFNKISIQTQTDHLKESRGIQSQYEYKLLKTYEEMVKNSSKFICKKCHCKLRHEKFLDHILNSKCQ